MDICHITLTAERDTRLPLFADENLYFEALHRLGKVCQGCLALFALIAEHLHLVALRSRLGAGRLAQAVLVSLRPIVATPLAPSHIATVDTRAHLRWLLRYILEQPKEHAMPGHPALWVGSCLPDLVGARRIPGLDLCIETVLPDFSQASAFRILGLPGSTLAAPDRTTLRLAGADRIRRATSAALGVEPALSGKSSRVLEARRAMAQLAARVGIHRAEITAALGHCPRTAYRLFEPAAAPEQLMTIARRIALEDRVQVLAVTGTPSPRAQAFRRSGAAEAGR